MRSPDEDRWLAPHTSLRVLDEVLRPWRPEPLWHFLVLLLLSGENTLGPRSYPHLARLNLLRDLSKTTVGQEVARSECVGQLRAISHLCGAQTMPFT